MIEYAVVGAKSVIARPDGNILLLKRSPQSKKMPGEWDFPGGKLDAGEDVLEALVREIREETNMDVSKSDFNVVWTETEFSDDELTSRITFLAKLPEVLDIQLSHEHVEHVWMPLEVALQEHAYPPHKRVLDLIHARRMIS